MSRVCIFDCCGKPRSQRSRYCCVHKYKHSRGEIGSRWVQKCSPLFVHVRNEKIIRIRTYLGVHSRTEITDELMGIGEKMIEIMDLLT